MSAKSSGLNSASANTWRQLTDSGGAAAPDAGALGSSLGLGCGGLSRCGAGEVGLDRRGEAGCEAGGESTEDRDEALEKREDAGDGRGLGIGVATRGLGGDLGGDTRGCEAKSGMELTRVGTVGGLLGMRAGTPGPSGLPSGLPPGLPSGPPPGLPSGLGSGLASDRGDFLGEGLGVVISSTRHWLGGSILRTRPIRTAISRSGSIVPRCDEPKSLRSVTDSSSSICPFLSKPSGHFFFSFSRPEFFFRGFLRRPKKFFFETIRQKKRLGNETGAF